jgi:hypothetical protein
LTSKNTLDQEKIKGCGGRIEELDGLRHPSQGVIFTAWQPYPSTLRGLPKIRGFDDRG